MSCGDSGTNRPLQFRFPASDYVPPVPEAIADVPTRDYLLDLRKQLSRMFDATRTVTQDIQAPVVWQVNLDANLSLSAGVATKVPFNFVRYDTHGYWSPTNYRFNPRIAGFYRLSWSVCFGPDAGGNNLCTAQLVVSGNRNDIKAQIRNSSTAQNVTAATSTNLYLDGDTDVYIEIWATSVAAVALVNDPALTFLTVDYVGDIQVGALSGANFVSTDGSIRINTDDDSVYAIGKPGLGRIEVQGYAPTVINSSIPTLGELVRVASWTPALTALYGYSPNGLCAVANGNNVDIVTYTKETSNSEEYDCTIATCTYAGAVVSSSTITYGTLNGSGVSAFFTASNCYAAYTTGGYGNESDKGGWCNLGPIVTSFITQPDGVGNGAIDNAPCRMGNKIYARGIWGTLSCWDITGDDIAGDYVAGETYTLSEYAPGSVGSGMAAGDDGFLYVAAPDEDDSPPSFSRQALYKFNADLTLADLWHHATVDPARPAPAKVSQDYAFAVYGGYLVCGGVDNTTPTYYVYKFNEDGTLTEVFKLQDFLTSPGEVISLGNGFFVTRDGVLQLI